MEGANNHVTSARISKSCCSFFPPMSPEWRRLEEVFTCGRDFQPWQSAPRFYFIIQHVMSFMWNSFIYLLFRDDFFLLVVTPPEALTSMKLF